MNILSVHNRYVFGGGEDGIQIAERDLLQAHGHRVEFYSEDNRRIPELNRVRLAGRTVWSRETYRAVRAILQEQPFDVVHVHNYCPLVSPSVYYAAHREGVATVQTLNNYRQVCPSGTFFRNGKVCEDCLHKRFKWPAIAHACYRQSRAASAAVSSMLFTHRVAGTWTRRVDAYIANTTFSRERYVAGGLPADKVHIKPNFIATDPGEGGHAGGYALFAGRLSPEKGLLQLLEVWGKLDPGLPLKVAGDGPLRNEVETMAANLPNVEYVGLADRERMHELMQEALFLVFPSTWYECMPLTILEAFAAGMPVVGPDLGPMSLMIEDGRTGLHFEPGNSDHMLQQIQRVVNQPDEARRMGREARKEYLAAYTAEQNYRGLLSIYQAAISRRHKSGAAQ